MKKIVELFDRLKYGILFVLGLFVLVFISFPSPREIESTMKSYFLAEVIETRNLRAVRGVDRPFKIRIKRNFGKPFFVGSMFDIEIGTKVCVEQRTLNSGRKYYNIVDRNPCSL